MSKKCNDLKNSLDENGKILESSCEELMAVYDSLDNEGETRETEEEFIETPDEYEMDEELKYFNNFIEFMVEGGRFT